MFRKKTISLVLSTAMASAPFTALATENDLYFGAVDKTNSVSYAQAFGYQIETGTITGGTIECVDYAIAGSSVVISVSPNSGMVLDTLTYTVDGETISNDIKNEKSFTMPTKKVIINATFKSDENNFFESHVDYAKDVVYSDIFKAATGEYTITDFNSSLGKVTASNSKADVDDVITITVTPGKGCRLVDGSLKVKNGDIEIPIENNSFKMPDSDVTIEAEFEQISYAITVDATSENGSVSCINSEAKYNGDVTVTVTPDDNYIIDKLYYKVNGSDAEYAIDKSENTFKMPDNDITIYATFKAIQRKIEIGYGEGGSASISKSSNKTGDTVLHGVKGEKITIFYTPNEGYTLDKILINDSDMGSAVTEYNIDNRDTVISVMFKKIDYEITKAQISEGGSIDISGTQQFSETIDVTVNPTENWEIDRLYYIAEGTNDEVAITNGTFVMPSKNVTVYATFRKIIRNVTVKPGIENGGVSIQPVQGVEGDLILVTPTANRGYVLDKVYNGETPVDADSEGKYYVTVTDSDIVVSAIFNAIDYQLAIADGIENGTISLGDSETANINDEITVTVNADDDYELESLYYTIGDSTEENPIDMETKTFIMPADDVTVHATFRPSIKNVTVDEEIENGSVSVEPQSGYANTEVEIIAEPNMGYEIDKVYSNEIEVEPNTDGKYIIIIQNSNIEVSATFKKINYSVSKGAETNGVITVSSDSANYGDEITVEANPNTGYMLGEVYYTVDGSDDKNIINKIDNVLKFNMPANNVKVFATFIQKKVNISSSIVNGTVTSDKTVGITNDIVTLTPVAKVGYKIKTVKVNGIEIVPVDGIYSYTIVDSDLDVTAEFEAIDYDANLYVNSNGSATFKVNGVEYTEYDTAIIHVNDVISIQTDPNSGYSAKFEVKRKDLNQKINVSGSSFKAPASNIDIDVTFTKKTTGGNSGGGVGLGSAFSAGVQSSNAATPGNSIAVANGGVSASGVGATINGNVVTLITEDSVGIDKTRDIIVKDEDGNIVANSFAENGVVKFISNGGNYKVENAEEKVFRDVLPDSWFKADVDFITTRGIMNGVSEDNFAADGIVTRGMVVTTLQRLADKLYTASNDVTFTDVYSSDWQYIGVDWAVKNGIANGFDNNLFNPNEAITREQLSIMLTNYAKKIAHLNISKSNGINNFSDANQISDWAKDSFNESLELGIITGRDETTLSPKDNAKRAELCTMLKRLISICLK